MTDYLPTRGLPESNTPPGSPYGRGSRLTPEVIEERLARGRVNADALEEQLVRLTPGRALDLVLGGEDCIGGRDHAAVATRTLGRTPARTTEKGDHSPANACGGATAMPISGQSTVTRAQTSRSEGESRRRDGRERPAPIDGGNTR